MNKLLDNRFVSWISWVSNDLLLCNQFWDGAMFEKFYSVFITTKYSNVELCLLGIRNNPPSSINVGVISELYATAKMLRRPVRDMIQVHRKAVSEYVVSNFMNIVNFKTTQCRFFSTIGSFSPFTVLPRTSKKCERKPMVISVNELKRQGRRQRKEWQGTHENVLKPPENGLLVKELVPIAHEVYACRAQLVTCISRVLNSIPIYSCSLCGEVHVGHPPHKIRTCHGRGCPPSREHQWQRGDLEHILPQVGSFHLYDRVGRAVLHEEGLQVDQIPAVTELCIQAGLDIPEYPTRRRTFPVYSIAGKIMDFERRLSEDDYPCTDFEMCGFWKNTKNPAKAMDYMDSQSDDLQGFAIRGMEAWERLRLGASKLMHKYGVLTCGHCSEVHVGPRGHRVRNCQAFKHQMRDGQHAWQIATIDDLIPPVYVWHGQKLQVDGPLVDRLKRYYGKLPAVVEMFAQAGAPVGESYSAMMRDDVAVPGLDEEKLVEGGVSMRRVILGCLSGQGHPNPQWSPIPG